MSGHSEETTPELRFLRELVDAHVQIAGDVLQLGSRTWAIHGSIPVDGGVLVAEYDSFDEARDVLAQLGPNQVGPPSWPGDRELRGRER